MLAPPTLSMCVWECVGDDVIQASCVFVGVFQFVCSVPRPLCNVYVCLWLKLRIQIAWCPALVYSGLTPNFKHVHNLSIGKNSRFLSVPLVIKQGTQEEAHRSAGPAHDKSVYFETIRFCKRASLPLCPALCRLLSSWQSCLPGFPKSCCIHSAILQF